MEQIWNENDERFSRFVFKMWCVTVVTHDVFEKFRNNRLKSYGLSPSHYLSAPALSSYTMVNKIKVEFELITDVNM